MTREEPAGFVPGDGSATFFIERNKTMSDQENEQALFRDNSQALIAQSDAAAVARATQEIQAALVIGQRNERNETKVKAKVLDACKRSSLAEIAEYEYNRGGTRITGPTIDLLRAIANRYGNLLFGWAEVDRREGMSSIRCWAWDTQSNSRAERTFYVKHWRDTQAGGYALTDERDIYEALANQASRRVRACLEEIIDADLVEAAVDQCRRTLKEGAKTPIKDRAIQMLEAFKEHAVTVEMIEKRLGNSIDAISENQLASLRRIWKSLKDGVGKREDYFKPETVPPNFKEAPKEEAAEAAAGLAPVQPAPAAPVTPAPAPEPEEQPSDVKLLRLGLKTAKIPEGVFLTFIADLGMTDGSISTLEELALQNKAALQQCVKNWKSLSERVKEAIKAAK